MRSKVILFLSIMIPFSLVFIYVWSTATDMIFGEDFLAVKLLVEKYYDNTLTLSDYWKTMDYCRPVGYVLLLFTNIKLFSWNSKIFALLIPFCILASALLIYRAYRKSLVPECSPEFIAASFFILAFIVFNIIQYEVLFYGYAITYQYAMPFAIASFISLESFLLKGTGKYLLASLVLSALYILVFNGRLIFAFAPALCATFLFHLIIYRSNLSKDFWLRTSIITIFLAVFAFIYLFRIHSEDYVAHPSYFASDIFSQPLQAVRFLLNSFAANVVSIDLFFASDYFSFYNIQIIGLVIVLFYIFALVLFFLSHMYDKTYLPFFLIMQTFFYFGLMAFRRFGLGIDWGMASRYTCISLYGLAAVAWIFIFTLTRRIQPNAILKGVIYAGFMMIFAGLLLSSIVVWRIQPAQKAHLMRIREIAMRIDKATPEDILKIDSVQEFVRDSLLFLKEHRLNIYRNLPANADQDQK